LFRHVCPHENGTVIGHGDHNDFLFDNVLHCSDVHAHCVRVDLVDIPAKTEWDELFEWF
jgi:hypothetical protein